MAGLCAGLMVVSAQAAFQLVENFDGDSLTLGDINGQNDWVASPGSNELELDPAGGSNQVLKVLTESGILHKAASVAQGTTRMLFLRVRFEEHGAFSFGLSHLFNPDEFSDFGPELGMAAANANDPGNDFRVANGLTTGIYDVLETLVPTTWYNTWVLVDTTSDTYEVWMNLDPGGDAQASDQLSNDVAETLFGFRTATAADLINFYIKTGGGDSPVDGRFYIDDIYLEDTDDTNLNNPLGGDTDSNDDGISDADALALGLDPNDPDGDTDGDGASDVDETGGDPENPLPVDTDVDGVIDALEPGESARDARVASGLRLPSGDTATITTAAGEMLSQVSAAVATGGPSGIIFPFGSISYTTSSPVGGNVTVRMAFSADLPIFLGQYKVDNKRIPSVFTELPTSIWTLVDSRTVDINLTDGDPLTDLDGVPGSIEDPVAPAELEPSVSSSSSGGGGCALNIAVQEDPDPLFPLLMLAVLGYWFRRLIRNT
jgi:hypothetical protein